MIDDELRRQISEIASQFQLFECNTCALSIHSTNGRHEAIAVQINGEELIFDNIHNQGIPRQEWLGKFYCLAIELGGQFEIEEIEF